MDVILWVGGGELMYILGGCDGGSTFFMGRHFLWVDGSEWGGWRYILGGWR